MANVALEKEDLFMFLQKVIRVRSQISLPDTLVNCAFQGQTAKSLGRGQVALVPQWKPHVSLKGVI